MACAEKYRLLKLYSLRTGDYSRAVTKMQGKCPTYTWEDYTALYGIVADAWKQCDYARRNLEWHICDHGC